MLHNYLAAALRNLVRNRLYAAISILSLAVGFGAAIVTGLYIRDELSFDFFIPGHDKLYVVTQSIPFPGRPDSVFALGPPQAATWFTQDFANTIATGACINGGTIPSLRHGEVEALEPVAWVDANFFSLLAVPVVAGNPAATVSRADGVVITRALARQFFGKDAPVGELLEINRTTTLSVGAVIEDLPATTNLSHKIFASLQSTAAPQNCVPNQPYPMGVGVTTTTRIFMRLKDEAVAADINRAMPDFVARNMGWLPGKEVDGRLPALHLIRLDDLHMTQLPEDTSFAPGNPKALLALSLIAGLTLLIAGINFVNLMVARSTRRMVEVGVRKLSGAERRHLVVQFIGELLIYAFIAVLVAAMLTYVALPGARGVLGRPLEFAVWRDPVLCGCVLFLCLAVGGLAGAYPALVQSRFRPVAALKGGWSATLSGIAVREGLVVIQFVFLICLILAVLVIARQTRFAMNEGLRVDKDQVMTMDISPVDLIGKPRRPEEQPSLCRNAFVDAVRNLPGVRGAACSSASALDLREIGRACLQAARNGGLPAALGCSDVDFGFFEMFGLKPIAGRFFSPAFVGDDARRPPVFRGRGLLSDGVVLNEAAVRALGFENAGAAVGQTIHFGNETDAPSVNIIGVAPDFTLDLLHGDVRPKFYSIVTPHLDTLNIKLAGREIPETVAAIDLLWKKLGEPRAPSHSFVDTYLQAAFASTLRQGLLVDILCGIAILVAALGLFGLSAFTAERRTKEIGVRKALGAGRLDILRMLLWEFAKPVLWANVIAWPLAYLSLHRWLAGFTYRIALQPWMFLTASALALAIAVLTVAGHALMVARAEPLAALRYE